MTPPSLLSVNDAILWLKVGLSAATLAVLYYRYKERATGSPSKGLNVQTRAVLVLVALLSLGVFHNLGAFRGGTFVHHSEMFHYYLGPKYFKELGYYELYNAVLVADAEQDDALAQIPFYTNLKTYRNSPRETALRDSDRVRALFSERRWSEFKSDVAFFKQATETPHSQGLFFLLIDHGYNGSPLSTLVLGTLSNAIPVNHLHALAYIDVLLVLAMGAFVYWTFGFDTGTLFSVYFCVNILNAYDYISGSLLRYDWLFCIIAGVCLQKKKRYALSGVFLALAAVLRVFPALLFYGIAVKIVQGLIATRTIRKEHLRFALAAATATLALIVLPSVSLGAVVEPWKDFISNTQLHNAGVYVNHLGFRAIALFEPSHLSLDQFFAAYKSAHTTDIVRHWQDVKEFELRQKAPLLAFISLAVLVSVTMLIRKRNDFESIIWPLLLIYTTTFLAHYYYGFLCLFILLFFSWSNSLTSFVPLCLLMLLNIAILLTDYFRPSPIVLYTLTNLYLFVFMATILGFCLYTLVITKRREAPAQAKPTAQSKPRNASPRHRRGPRR